MSVGSDPRHCVGRPGCLDGGREGRHIHLVLVHDSIDAVAHSLHPYRRVGVAGHQLLSDDEQRRSSVGLRCAVEHAEGLGHHGGRQHLLDRDLLSQLGLRVGHRMLVVLDRDHGEVLPGGRRLVQVTPDVQCEIGGRHQSERDSPRPCPGSWPSSPRRWIGPRSPSPCRPRRRGRRRHIPRRPRTPRCATRPDRWRTRSPLW